MASNIDIKKYGLVLIAGLLAFEYIYMPWQNWLETTNSDIERKAMIVAKQQKAIANKQVYQQIIDEYENSFQSVTASFDNIKDTSQASINWLGDIDYVSRQFKIPVKSKTPLEVVEINDNFVGFTGRVELEGDISTLLTFLAEIDNNKSGNIVTDIRLIKQRNNVRIPYILELEVLKVFKVIS